MNGCHYKGLAMEGELDVRGHTYPECEMAGQGPYTQSVSRSTIQCVVSKRVTRAYT